ncbi:hypothetical protein L208DRAFT_1305449 [Tricholoma matsutake]|nr:hypothetical protein L208DRAFT_1305449 [Tricholoma matsutake 945]
MLSCKDLYRINERLAKVMNNTDQPFGGLGMIFAGNFAQLPPAIGQEHAVLYSPPPVLVDSDQTDWSLSGV